MATLFSSMPETESTQSPSENPGGDPLTPDHRRQLAEADRRARRVLRAAKVASFNGWTIGGAAAFSAMFAVFSVVGLIATILLAIIAFNEFRGRDRLRRFDRRATRLLGWNQVAFMIAIVVYCAYAMYRALYGPLPAVSELMQSGAIDSASYAEIERLVRTVAAGAYGLIILLTIIFQGGNAWYYFSRGPIIEAYLRETPEWVVDLQRRSRV